jgi:hypothetical protein
MENDISALDGDTVDYYENFNARLKKNRSSVKKPNPIKLADVVKDILLTSKPHFRYQINRVCKEAARQKLIDESGDSYIEEAAEKYLLPHAKRENHKQATPNKEIITIDESNIFPRMGVIISPLNFLLYVLCRLQAVNEIED